MAIAVKSSHYIEQTGNFASAYEGPLYPPRLPRLRVAIYAT